MNNNDLFEYIKRSNENILQQIQQGEQRVIDALDDYKSVVNPKLVAIETNLNGNSETEGLNEWRRNFYKRHALISGLVPSVIIIGWELAKHKLTGKW